MKTIRKIASNPFFITLLIANFLFASCSTDTTSEENIENLSKSAKTKISDELVFKGIMFLEGPIADKFPEFKELNFRNFISDKTQINNVLKFQDNVNQNILKNNPNYLKEFRENISSGNFYIVKQAIIDAGMLIKENAIKLSGTDIVKANKIINDFANNISKKNKLTPNSSIEEIKQASRQSKQVLAGDTVWFDTDTVVWAVVAVAGAVVIVGAIALVLIAPPQDGESNSYMKDKYPSDITLQLKGI